MRARAAGAETPAASLERARPRPAGRPGRGLAAAAADQLSLACGGAAPAEPAARCRCLKTYIAISRHSKIWQAAAMTDLSSEVPAGGTTSR